MFNQPGPGGPQQPLPMSNVIMALSLMALVYVAYFFLFPQPALDTAEQAETTAIVVEGGQDPVRADSLTVNLMNRFGQAGVAQVNSLDAAGREVAHGKIDVSSGLFYDLTLTDYRETLDPESPEVTLFGFAEDGLPYVFQPYVRLGTGSTIEQDVLFEQVASTTGTTVLRSTNLETAIVEVELRLQDQHLYGVTLRAESTTGEAQNILLGARLLRAGLRDAAGAYDSMPGVETIWTARQGLAFFDDGRVKRQAYNQVADDTDAGSRNSVLGAGTDWIALADKYFMSALIRDPANPALASYDYIEDSGYFRANLTNGADGQLLTPDAPVEFNFTLFAGPKELDLLRKYETDLGAEQFAFTIDFGWFWYFTMPFTVALAWLGDLVGNVGVAILIITVIIKLFLYPLANNSYRSMARMKKLQPKMEELREQHGDDRQALSQATMALYRAEGANPIAGCLPILVQIPIFFALYKVIFNTIEIRHAPFFGWVQDMSVADPTSWINVFGLLPYDVPGIFATGGLLALLSVGVWPILMGLTMVWQQRLSPAPTDPTQAMVMRFLPIIFTFFMATFPAGLVIYWTWNNFLSVLQQMVIMRGTKTETEEKKEAETERQKAKAASKKKA